MDSDRWKLIAELADAALERPGPERERFLVERAAGDAELLAEVRSLLRQEPDSEGFLEAPAPAAVGELAQKAGESLLPGEAVGAYRVVRRLGGGGMGAVYLAERADGQFERQVAVKLVKRGMDTEAILGRFERERRVLAGLQHPGIAQLLDGGTHSDGRPYLVLEYVRGQAIDRYCRARGLDFAGCLELFLEVLEAVDHAHASGVVHRDVKPSNVMVGDDGHVKLLDFGLAKLLAPSGRSATYDVTTEGERLLTPHYAAPEQLRGEPVGPATDVYALGVLLYELLSGRRPYELDGRPWAAVETTVCELDPPRPSDVLPADGGTAGLRRALAGDLDTIVMKALRKEPERRYGTARELAEDLRRHLEGRPIAARPDTVGYRLSKYVRRNALLVGSALAIIATLTIALVAVLRQVRIAERLAEESSRLAIEKGEALAAAERALANLGGVNEFMAQVLRAGEARRLGKDVTVLQAVDAAARKVDELVEASPWVEGTVRTLVGTTYRSLGALEAAIDQLERAVAVRTAELGAQHSETTKARVELALAHYDAGESDEAEALAGALWDEVASARGLELLGLIAADRGEYAVATAHLREAAELLTAELGESHRDVVIVRKHLAGMLVRGDRDLDAAERELRDLLELQERVLGPRDLDTAITRVDLATCLRKRGQEAEPEALYRAALEGFEAELPPEHLDRAITTVQLGALLVSQARWPEVLELAEPLLDPAREALGPDHVVTGNTRWLLARAYAGLGRFDEAATVERATLESAERAHGPDAAWTQGVLRNLAQHLLHAGRLEEARPVVQRAFELAVRHEGEDHASAADAACFQALVLAFEGDLDAARERLERYLPRVPAGHVGRARHELTRGRVLRLLERFGEAEEALLAVHAVAGSQGAAAGAGLAPLIEAELRELYLDWGDEEAAGHWTRDF